MPTIGMLPAMLKKEVKIPDCAEAVRYIMQTERLTNLETKGLHILISRRKILIRAREHSLVGEARA